MTSQIPSIHTANLSLRSLLPEDAVRLHQIYESDGVLRYFPNPIPPPLIKVQRFIAGQIVHWESYGYGDWAIVPNNQENTIGWAGLQYLPELDETEVGFMLDRLYWGRGYATEATKASLGYDFERLNLEHATALVHPENLASRRVLEKCGMGYVENISLWGIELMRYHIEKQDWINPNL